MFGKVNSMSQGYLREAWNKFRASANKIQRVQEIPNMNVINGTSQNVPKCYWYGKEGHLISACI